MPDIGSMETPVRVFSRQSGSETEDVTPGENWPNCQSSNDFLGRGCIDAFLKTFSMSSAATCHRFLVFMAALPAHQQKAMGSGSLGAVSGVVSAAGWGSMVLTIHHYRTMTVPCWGTGRRGLHVLQLPTTSSFPAA
ncbi:protein Wnt-7a [Platysternon megacephalum]|uniref:Protein Wnt-7a n=1 Tax=Platysternon megacephalum TaxID=55544 RepID=A0A4D9E1X2_9SAUR|nr:protein Wnt-7a [Platysternon megacephalum]